MKRKDTKLRENASAIKFNKYREMAKLAVVKVGDTRTKKILCNTRTEIMRRVRERLKDKNRISGF